MNREVQRIIETSLSDLLPAVTARKHDGCRLVAITATTNGNRYEICYSFDRLYRVQTHRVTLPEGASLPGITGIYPSAFVYENELHDIFGIAVAGRRESGDNRPRKRFTYPVELGVKTGDASCRNR